MLVAGLVVVIEVFAEQIAHLVAGGFLPDLLAVTTTLLRIMTPAVWFFAVSGVVTAVLFALKRFAFPAFAAAVYNLGIIVAALLLHERLSIYSLAIGVIIGSVLQLALLLPDLVRSKVHLRLGLRHPALPRIWRLYLPILFGLLVSQIQVIIDRRLASGTGDQSLAWMRDATTLFQLPHGLVAVAISLLARRAKTTPIFLAGLMWWLGSIIPSSIVEKDYVAISPRAHYLPAIGGSVIWAICLVALWRVFKSRRVLQMGLVAAFALTATKFVGFAADRLNEAARLTPALNMITADTYAAGEKKARQRLIVEGEQLNELILPGRR